MEVPIMPNNNKDNDDVEVMDKCRQWVESVSISDTFSDDGRSDVTSAISENSAMESGFVFQDDGINVCDSLTITTDGNDGDNEIVNKILKKQSNSYNKIQIYKSRKVHIGDVTHINGPVYVNQVLPSIINTNRQITINNNTDDGGNGGDGTSIEFPIIRRRNWLAQPPLEPQVPLETPVKFVVIIHSATEEAFTQADNTYLVRLIQGFHIESRKMADIAYGFLVGADGTVFEGRGWGVQGAHAHRYNKYSIGICVVGCFMQHKPTDVAMEKVKALIQKGIELNQISKDYSLLAHCQCSPTESPGGKFYEEIKTWDHWDGSISVANPYPPTRLI